MLPLLDVLKSRLDTDSAPHLHRALTTQDVVDTATMVMARDATAALRDLGEACWTALRSATDRFGSVATEARSFLQAAETTTFAARFDRWSAPLDTLGRVQVAFPVQLGGLTGERKGISDGVVEIVAQALDLDPAPRSWHTDRTPVLDLVTLALRYAQWAEKVAGDIAILERAGRGDDALRRIERCRREAEPDRRDASDGGGGVVPRRGVDHPAREAPRARTRPGRVARRVVRAAARVHDRGRRDGGHP